MKYSPENPRPYVLIDAKGMNKWIAGIVVKPFGKINGPRGPVREKASHETLKRGPRTAIRLLLVKKGSWLVDGGRDAAENVAHELFQPLWHKAGSVR
jgi:predicted sugar kinase